MSGFCDLTSPTNLRSSQEVICVKRFDKSQVCFASDQDSLMKRPFLWLVCFWLVCLLALLELTSP